MKKLIVEQRLLALDLGSKRIGVATWNPIVRFASPQPVLNRQTLAKDLEVIRDLLTRYEIEAIVVGYPLNLSNKKTEGTQNADFWVKKLQEVFGLQVYTQDESLSSMQAEEALSHLTRDQLKKARDSQAAVYILEEFIREQVPSK